MTASVHFVGRERELSSLRAALDGDTRMLLVAGDAGIGKSRLVAEGLRRAAADGIVSVSGACLPLAEKLPLLPVADALGELSRLHAGGLLMSALETVPPYVRSELGRLLPQLEDAAERSSQPGKLWQRERLFSAVADALRAVGSRSGLCLVIEDVHWADSATLDLLTFVVRAVREAAVTVVATCRSDETSLDAHVAQWLAHARGGVGIEEIRLSPMSRQEVAEHVAGLLPGQPVPASFTEELYARAEGNPFFTEQLVAEAAAGGEGGGPRARAIVPARLAELLAARVSGCGEDARAVLAALAVAGRPLLEDQLCGITGLDPATARRGLRQLSEARLLGASTLGGTYRPRHALVGEAVAGGLLPGERMALHERTARTLESAGDAALAAEVAGHWAAAAHTAEELPARMAAAGAAEKVSAYTEAGGHLERAIELCQMAPGAAEKIGIDLPRLYLQAIDALDVAGDGQRARVLAEEAYRCFAGDPDPATAAVIHQRVARCRELAGDATGLPVMKEALRLFELATPSADQAEAWFYYATLFLLHAEGQQEASLSALNQALAIAEKAGATSVIPGILSFIAVHAFLRGEIEEGFTALRRGRAVAAAAGDDDGALMVSVNESDALLKLGRFDDAADVALRALGAARQAGHHTHMDATILVSNAAEALVSRGRTAEAAALIDPLTTGSPDRDHWVVYECRAEIDMLRGEVATALRRQQEISNLSERTGVIDWEREAAQRATLVALWAGRPSDALAEVRRVLALFKAPALAVSCGSLLTIGMRACADLAGQARARRDGLAVGGAVAAADELAAWADRMGGVPFRGQPYLAAIPAERATWDAERIRLDEATDLAVWETAATAWEDLGCPHRAGYAWWRLAEAQLAAGHSRAAAGTLRTAAAAAETHAPLLAEIRKLADRAHIPLPAPPAPAASRPPPAPGRYGLTRRELAVLRLLAEGHTNAQIGVQLYMSPKTASVHVTSILRKLGVTSRVQAAAIAERAGLLEQERT